MPKKKKESIFKLMKVVDCQSMPDKVKKAFFESTRGTDNDCYVEWYIEDFSEYEGDEIDQYKFVVDTWLKENGLSQGADILISHWW